MMTSQYNTNPYYSMPSEEFLRDGAWAWQGTADEFVQSTFRNVSDDWERASLQPQEMGAQISPAQVEAENIVAKIVAADRAYTWLAGEDITDVMRVIATVRQCRAQFAEKGEAVADRTIYLRYRRAIEVDNPSKRLKISTRIIEALMRGNLSGELPF
jgi:hypothetical protein